VIGSPQQAAAEAILAHLQQATGEEPGAEQAWHVEMQLTAQQRKQLASTQGAIVATGGASPWVGSQSFELACETAEGAVRIPVTAQVSLPSSVVTVTRSVPKGAVLRAADVVLVAQDAKTSARNEEAFHAIGEVLGKEAMRPIAPGQVLDNSNLRRPVLIRRGEVVTVYARAAGIEVRTTGRALDDGSEGDLVGIESIDGPQKRQFDAKVCGPQTVEVWAGGVK
jgi:flagella basal body P-ring formation protein FlgA